MTEPRDITLHGVDIAEVPDLLRHYGAHSMTVQRTGELVPAGMIRAGDEIRFGGFMGEWQVTSVTNRPLRFYLNPIGLADKQFGGWVDFDPDDSVSLL